MCNSGIFLHYRSCLLYQTLSAWGTYKSWASDLGCNDIIRYLSSVCDARCTRLFTRDSSAITYVLKSKLMHAESQTHWNWFLWLKLIDSSGVQLLPYDTLLEERIKWYMWWHSSTDEFISLVLGNYSKVTVFPLFKNYLSMKLSSWLSLFRKLFRFRWFEKWNRHTTGSTKPHAQRWEPN